ncbi:hypothetical protein ACOMHN_043973 [Nucella lapillus]
MTLEESSGDCKEEVEEEAPTLQSVHTAPVTKAVIHACVDPPLCDNCQRLELSFFDPMCGGCRDILSKPSTSVPEVFAILRQWTPQTQQSLGLLVEEILKRGATINDRDGLTDMTLLHYASKAGAAGIGDPDLAAQVVSDLVNKGADVNIRCRWTNMTALHYAAYFNVVSVIKVLLKTTKAFDIESTCAEFEDGTSLHIAASNLAHEAIKVLIQNGADVSRKDDLGRTPADCVPDSRNFDKDSDIGRLAQRIRKTLQEATPSSPAKPLPNYDLVQSKVMLQALGLQLGDQIVVSGAKSGYLRYCGPTGIDQCVCVQSGYLRYCGPTEFAPGVWAGLELDEPVGKNDGSVGGISYFKCPDNHGVFAPINKVSKPGAVAVSRTSPTTVPHSKGQVDISHITARVDTGLSKSRPSSSTSDCGEMEIGDRVIVAGQRKGSVRFIGEAQFAPGVWFGVELDQPAGKNNGSVAGVQYFSCRPKHGVFAPLSRIQKLGDRHFSSNESLDTISWGAVSEKLDRKAQGTVRYIGTTDFADGMWIGVELRTAKGKNDGSVQERRYFTCRPHHGLLVRPGKVSSRGINGAKLLGEISPSPSDSGRRSRGLGERDSTGTHGDGSKT